jgi:hypothetical protein
MAPVFVPYEKHTTSISMSTLVRWRLNHLVTHKKGISAYVVSKAKL